MFNMGHGWTINPSIRIEKEAAIGLLVTTCCLTWGRYNILTAMFFTALAFLLSNMLIDSYRRNRGLQKKISSFLSLFAPAVSPLLTFTNSFIHFTDSSRTFHKETFCNTSPSIENEITTLVHHIVEDFILFWYRVVSPDDDEFVDECRSTFNNMFVTFARQELSNVHAHNLLSQALIAIRKHILSMDKEIGETQVKQEEEKAIRMMTSISEYMLAACAPESLNRMNGSLVLSTSGHHPQRDSVYVMVREMLTFGVMMPITCRLSDPSLLFRSIAGLLSSEEKVKRTDRMKDCLSSGKQQDNSSDQEKDSLFSSSDPSPQPAADSSLDHDPKSRTEGHVVAGECLSIVVHNLLPEFSSSNCPSDRRRGEVRCWIPSIVRCGHRAGKRSRSGRRAWPLSIHSDI